MDVTVIDVTVIRVKWIGGEGDLMAVDMSEEEALDEWLMDGRPYESYGTLTCDAFECETEALAWMRTGHVMPSTLCAYHFMVTAKVPPDQNGRRWSEDVEPAWVDAMSAQRRKLWEQEADKNARDGKDKELIAEHKQNGMYCELHKLSWDRCVVSSSPDYWEVDVRRHNEVIQTTTCGDLAESREKAEAWGDHAGQWINAHDYRVVRDGSAYIYRVLPPRG